MHAHVFYKLIDGVVDVKTANRHRWWETESTCVQIDSTSPVKTNHASSLSFNQGNETVTLSILFHYWCKIEFSVICKSSIIYKVHTNNFHLGLIQQIGELREQGFGNSAVCWLHSERGRIATAQYICQDHGVRSVSAGKWFGQSRKVPLEHHATQAGKQVQ